MGLVNEGVLLTQRGLGALLAAMTEADVDRFVEALGRVLERGRLKPARTPGGRG